MATATATIEERLTKLEEKVAQLSGEQMGASLAVPWWESITGTFADSPDYEEAMKLGRAYRESLRPQDKDEESHEE